MYEEEVNLESLSHSHGLGRRGHCSRVRIAAAAVLLIVLTGTSCTGVTPRNSQFYLTGNYNFAFYDTHGESGSILLCRSCGTLRHLRGRTHEG